MANQLPPASTPGSELVPSGDGDYLPIAHPELDFQDGGAGLRRPLSAILRYKWLILLGTVVGSILGVLVVERMVQPSYTAQTTIWIEGVQPRGAGPQQPNIQPIQGSALLTSQGWQDLVRSNAVLEQVVVEQRRYVRPATLADSGLFRDFRVANDVQGGAYRLVVDSAARTFTLEGRRGFVLEQGRVGDAVGQRLGFRWQPSASALGGGRTVDFTVLPPRDAAARLASDLRVRLDAANSFLRLELSGRNAHAVVATVNSIAERFVELATDLKREKVTDLESILAQQVRQAREYLEEAEADLERFQVETITQPLESSLGAQGTDGAASAFLDTKAERESLERDRENVTRLLRQVRDGAEVPVLSLELIASVQASSELTQALEQLTALRVELRGARRLYTDEHPSVRATLEQIEPLERQTIPVLLQHVLQQISVRIAELDARLAFASDELRTLPPRATEEARLQRRLTMANNLFSTVQSRYDEARVAAVTTIPDMRILDRATVPGPAGDKRRQYYALVVLATFALAVVAAVGVDRIDPRLRYPEQVSELGLITLGAVPHVMNGKKTGRLAARDKEVNAHVVEAFREIRMNLSYAYGTAGPMMITVSSPGEGDGKSFVTMNLAQAYAVNGHRTLLIDGDVRRGVLHASLGCRRRPGLTDYLAGEAPLGDVVQDTSIPLLSLVPVGTRHSSAPELLAGKRMGELLAAVGRSYSVILVDSPPLSVAVDPLALAVWTRSLLIVLRTGTTNRAMAGLKMESVSRLPIRLLGAVLNDVPPHGLYRYYSYLPYGELPDESDAWGQRPADAAAGQT